jgi:hypothetical protein
MADATPEPTISSIRRKLISATAPAEPVDARSESIDFDHYNSENGEQPMMAAGLEKLLKQPAAPKGHDEMELLLQRYQAEKGLSGGDPPPAAPPAPRAPMHDHRPVNGNQHNGGLRPPPPKGLPPLGKGRNSEVQRLEEENAELRQLVNEYREVLEANDPTIWEQKVAAAEQAVAEKDQQLEEMMKKVAEWEEKFKTHRFVPHDNELAQEADEIDKERAKLVQERKEVESEREQLKEDEDAMMKQMREMEMGMAKDRAELARQRTELQRIQAEIKYELEQLERGDGSMKERLAQFQRRYNESVLRPGAPPVSMPAAAQPMLPPESEQTVSRPRDTMFKKIFGK